MVPLLITRDLSIQFGGLTAVNRVEFHIGSGEAVGLIGPNGSGKTTFFNLLTGIYRPTQGRIEYDGNNLVGLPAFQIARRGIARTFQNSRLFLGLSILDNVLSGMHAHQDSNWLDAIFRRRYVGRELRQGVEKALELLGWFSRELAEDCYKKAGDLPLGDRRKVEICRALASQPKLLLLDEPSAGMSPEETEALMEDIRRLRDQKREMAIILIEHDMMVIRGVAGRVVVLNYGRKIAEGTFAEISRDEGVLEAYLGREEGCVAPG
ncbi:MAG: ABC transporter ATP-binding protein [Syntrophaceae bacterium]|nr:ABC transporter ATP-binding protein [Syntrophaceae bacterium]